MYQLKTRLNGTKTKANRIRRLRRCGVNTAVWVSSAGIPGMLYSADITGVADSMLKTQRSLAARTASAPGAGKNPTIANWIQDCKGTTTNPAFSAHESPLHMYATAWWEDWIPRDVLTNAHDAAATALTSSKFAWNAAKGPFAATILSARRLGWTFKDAETISTDLGEDLDVTRDSQDFIKCQVREAVRR